MIADPTFWVELGHLEKACREVREAVCALPRPRWFKTCLVLARLRSRGDLPEWSSTRLPVPARAQIGRRDGMTALENLFGMPHQSVLRSDRPDGAWALLGSPARVILDPLSNASGKDCTSHLMLIGVEPQSSSASLPRDPALQVSIDDRCLWWNDASAPCRCAERKVVEFNPVNDLGQQQGVVSAYPEEELRQLTDDAVRDVLTAPREQCHHRVPAPATVKASHICEKNDAPCAVKGGGAPGTGGPKILLSKQSASKGPTPVILAPEGLEILASEATGSGAAPAPSAHHLAVLAGWAKKAPDASSAPKVLVSFTDLGRLIGHGVVQRALAP